MVLWKSPFNIVLKALLSIQDGHSYYYRTFFNFLLLLYFKSKWVQILNAPAWQLLVLLIIQIFLWNCCQPIYTDYENKNSPWKPGLGWPLVGTLSNNVWTPHSPSNMDAIPRSKTFNKWPKQKNQLKFDVVQTF